MVNKVILIGNVGADPEIRTLESGVKVCQLRLATSEKVKKGEEWVSHTEWHNVVLWRGLADVADRFVRKGSQIYVEGILRAGEWTDKDGNTHRKVDIVAQELKLLGRKPETDSAPAPTATTTNEPLPSLAEQKRQLEATKRAEAYKQKYNIEVPSADVDDLPF